MRAAIVGTGYAARVHAYALRELGVAVAAVCGRSTTEELADELGAGAYDDLELLLDREQVDVLHVCTPNAAHAEQALAAFARGVHVICEKPLATSTEESAAMVEGAAGLVAATCYHVRGYPLVKRMRTEVESGRIGRVTVVHGRYACDDALVAPGGWRLDPAASGTSYVVGDLGTHWLDLAEHVTGVQVSEMLAEFKGEPLEEYAALLLRLEGGASGSLVIAAGFAGRKNDLLFECEGEGGGFTWDQEEPNLLLARLPTEPTRIVMKGADPGARYPAGHAEGYGDAFRNLFGDVYRAVAGEEHDPFPTFADGHHGVALLEAAVKSAREARWVAVA